MNGHVQASQARTAYSQRDILIDRESLGETIEEVESQAANKRPPVAVGDRVQDLAQVLVIRNRAHLEGRIADEDGDHLLVDLLRYPQARWVEAGARNRAISPASNSNAVLDFGEHGGGPYHLAQFQRELHDWKARLEAQN